jgi:hypothetical protein
MKQTIDCPYCSKALKISVNYAECNNCNVKYSADRDEYKLEGRYFITYEVFYFKDPIFYALSVNHRDNETIIWLHKGYNEHGSKDQKPIFIEGMFPINKLEDALRLSRRLHNLMVFM